MVQAVNCGGFYLWNLQEDPGKAFLAVSYCTASSNGKQWYEGLEVQPDDTRDPNEIAAQGTDCQGHYAPCSALCERGYERDWIEDVPRTGFGLSCPIPELNPAEDCVAGDGLCGSTDPCAQGSGGRFEAYGLLVDTNAGSGVLNSGGPSDSRRSCKWYIRCAGLSSPVLTFQQFDIEQGKY